MNNFIYFIYFFKFMLESRLINVYDLPTVDNVCDQILREVVSLSNVSVAHVIMNKENVSLRHQHSKMSEIYFILQGKGILYYGNNALQVEKGSYLVIPSNTPHKLKNVGNVELEHLVFAIPPFNSEDVEILNDYSNDDITFKKFSYNKKPVTALDGALVYELMTVKERKQLDTALAVGFLPVSRKAIPHYHKVSEELYYVIDGFGKIVVGEKNFEVKKGSLVYIPTYKVHALENESDSKELEVLCVSSPAYIEGDFILK